MAGLAGCLEGIKRANSPHLVGWVEGPVTKLKGGKRQVLLEDGKLICFVVGSEDIVLTKNDVDTVECVAQNLEIPQRDKVMVCNSYAVTLKNGEYGTFTIFSGKAAEFIIFLK